MSNINRFAYIPIQDLGIAFSIFVAHNYGVKNKERIKTGLKEAVLTVFIFSIIVILGVCLLQIN